MGMGKGILKFFCSFFSGKLCFCVNAKPHFVKKYTRTIFLGDGQLFFFMTDGFARSLSLSLFLTLKGFRWQSTEDCASRGYFKLA